MATDSGDGTELTTTQAAALAGVTEKTIRDWVKAGHITAARTTEGRRIGRASLLTYLRTRSREAVERLPPEARPHIAADPPTEQTTDSVGATEPVEAQYRVTPAEVERAVARTGARYAADLRAMLDGLREVYAGQVAAKDETIAAQRDALAELRRRAEAAEAECDALRQRLEAAQASPEAPGAAEAAGVGRYPYPPGAGSCVPYGAHRPRGGWRLGNVPMIVMAHCRQL